MDTTTTAAPSRPSAMCRQLAAMTVEEIREEMEKIGELKNAAVAQCNAELALLRMLLKSKVAAGRPKVSREGMDARAEQAREFLAQRGPQTTVAVGQHLGVARISAQQMMARRPALFKKTGSGTWAAAGTNGKPESQRAKK